MCRLRRDEATLCVATTVVPEQHAAPLLYAFPLAFSGDSGDFSPNATTSGRRLPPARCGSTAHSRYGETVRCRSRGWNVAGQPVLAWRDTRKGASLLAMRVHMADFQRASEVPGRLRVPVDHRVRHVAAVRFMRRLPELASPSAIALPVPGRPGRHPSRWRPSRATKNPAWAGFSVAAVTIDQSMSRKLRSCSERLG